MREKSRYQMNVSVVTESLRMRAGKDDPEEEAARVWKKFSETRQEPVKMAMALWGYFLKEGISVQQRLEQAGWFGEKELDDFIRTARERQKLQALVYLMKEKDAHYGYREEMLEL